MNSRPPLLRRFGSTGLTAPEIGLRLEAGAQQCPATMTALLEQAGQHQLGFIRCTTTAGMVDQLTVDGSCLVAVDAPAPAEARTYPLPTVFVVDDVTRFCRQAKPAQLVADWQDRGVDAVCARIATAQQARQVVEAGCFDGVEIDFSLADQTGLAHCLAELASWSGAVMVNALPSTRLDRAGVLAPADFDLLRLDDPETVPPSTLLAVRIALLAAATSVVTATVAESAVATLAGCSRELPPLARDELIELDRRIEQAGIDSRLELLWTLREPPFARSANRNQHRAPVTPATAQACLGEAWQLGPLRLTNRIVRSGTTERAVDGDGLPLEAMRQTHTQLAAGGAALVVTGYLAIAAGRRASQSHGVLAPGHGVAEWADILSSCRAVGTAAFCAQLGHGGALSAESYDRRQLVSEYRRSARAAAQAGFDAVQLHAAHGYFLGQLLAEGPPMRTRPSSHPGLELVLQVIDGVLAEVGAELAVLVKVNMSDFLLGGYDRRDADVAVAELARTGLHGIECSGWIPSAPKALTSSRLGDVEARSEGFFAPFAAGVKQRHPELAVGTCGGFRSAAGMARSVLRYGLDFVSLARPLVAEPDFPRRALTSAAVAFCNGCNECLAKHVRPVSCPRLSRHALEGVS
jgi:2,4-dienoyl-CoA reductase-like NADH-dependent reductase (Old Yellow Enzyme family)